MAMRATTMTTATKAFGAAKKGDIRRRGGGRQSRVTRAGLSANDAVDAVKRTVDDLKTVSGLKRVAERAALFVPVLLPAAATLHAKHLGGAGLGAFLAATGISAPVTFLAPVTGVMLFSSVGTYLQVAMATAGILDFGDDIPAAYCATVATLASLTLFAGSSLGFTDVFIRNGMAFHGAIATLLALKVAKFRELLTGPQAEALRKLALCGPTLMMSGLILQGCSMASFAAAGMNGPGILGPVGALMFNPITHYLNIFASFNYLMGVETKKSACFIASLLLIAGTSLCTQLATPYGAMLCGMHLACAFGLLRECTPDDSFIPSVL